MIGYCGCRCTLLCVLWCSAGGCFWSWGVVVSRKLVVIGW